MKNAENRQFPILSKRCRSNGFRRPIPYIPRIGRMVLSACHGIFNSLATRQPALARNRQKGLDHGSSRSSQTCWAQPKGTGQARQPSPTHHLRPRDRGQGQIASEPAKRHPTGQRSLRQLLDDSKDRTHQELGVEAVLVDAAKREASPGLRIIAAMHGHGPRPYNAPRSVWSRRGKPCGIPKPSRQERCRFCHRTPRLRLGGVVLPGTPWLPPTGTCRCCARPRPSTPPNHCRNHP